MTVQPNILFLDDEYEQNLENVDLGDCNGYRPCILMKVIRQLRQEYNVVCVEECDQALDLLTKPDAQFSMLILDLEMPIGNACEDLQYEGMMSGVVFAENLRSKYAINLPTVIYTSWPKNKVWTRLSKIGILDEDYIPKIDPKNLGRDTFPELKEAVDRYLKLQNTGKKE